MESHTEKKDVIQESSNTFISSEDQFYFENIFFHKVENTYDNIEMIISNILCQIGIPAHIKGYQFLRQSIMLTVKNPKIIYSVTKVLYPTVAESNNSTPSRVEKAIHHAIEIAWDRGNRNAIRYFLGYNYHVNEKMPSNSEFIAQISDKLRLNLDDK